MATHTPVMGLMAMAGSFAVSGEGGGAGARVVKLEKDVGAGLT